ncbi:MAG: GNAT family N-acetyltransferase [Candidatus Bathyarchaeota archaeon]|nr:GNAT family N-acetyltransferase [Candidatus Bathyarchaeota archaeon]
MPKVKLKDGRAVLVRRFEMGDKESLVDMYASLSDEALRWAMPPYTREIIERWLSNIQNLIVLVAVYDGKIVGHAQILKYAHARRKGTGDLIIYLHQDFHNVGLGTAMLRKLVEVAAAEGMHRLGLHVIADSERAVHLYEKLGFQKEGIMQASYLGEDGKYRDEVVMGLLLP